MRKAASPSGAQSQSKMRRIAATLIVLLLTCLTTAQLSDVVSKIAKRRKAKQMEEFVKGTGNDFEEKMKEIRKGQEKGNLIVKYMAWAVCAIVFLAGIYAFKDTTFDMTPPSVLEERKKREKQEEKSDDEFDKKNN